MCCFLEEIARRRNWYTDMTHLKQRVLQKYLLSTKKLIDRENKVSKVKRHREASLLKNP